MDNNLHNENDGLEDFFHDRLFGFQDEPGFDMWERIESGIPEKPKKNYKPFFIWASRAIAACLIISLGVFNYQYRNQLDHVALQLKDSKNSMASLEEKINNFYNNNLAQQQTVAQTTTTTDNNINTNPRIQKIVSEPQIIYVPVHSNESVAMVASETNTNRFEEIKPETIASTVSTSKSQQHSKKNTTKKRKVAQASIMAFASNHFNIANKEDILDLRKKVIATKNPIFVNEKKLNVPTSQLVMKKGKWGMGNDNTGVVNQLPISRITQKNRFKKNREADSMMKEWAKEGNRLQQAERSIDWDKIVGIGANYSINNNLSFFMGPDYWESSKKPSMLSTNNLYPYNVGIESGVTYHF